MKFWENLRRKIFPPSKKIIFYVSNLEWDKIGAEFEAALDKKLWECGIKAHSVGIDAVAKTITIYCYAEGYNTPIEDVAKGVKFFVEPLGGRVEKAEEE